MKKIIIVVAVVAVAVFVINQLTSTDTEPQPAMESQPVVTIPTPDIPKGEIWLRRRTGHHLVNGNIVAVMPGEVIDVLVGNTPTDAEITVSPANAATRLDANGQAVAGTVGRSVRIDAVSGEVWITLNKVWSSQPGAAGQLLIGPVTIKVTVQSVPQPTGNFVSWVGRYNPATGATTIWGRAPQSYLGQTLRFTVAGTVFANRPVDERAVASDGYIAPVQFTEPRGANQAYTITVEAGQGVDTEPQAVVSTTAE